VIVAKSITVVENVAYIAERELSAEFGETSNGIFVHGTPPPTTTKDPVIESDSHRRDLVMGEGDLSVIVEAGDELGDIRVGIQFEGPKGCHEHCLTKQNEVLQDGMAWLHEIFGQFDGDWRVHIISSPCPKGDSRILRLHEAQHRLESTHEVSPGPRHVHTVSHQNRTE
jgi:hypothetical protein